MRFFMKLLTGAAIMLLIGTTSHAGPNHGGRSLSPRTARDLNPDPNIVEVVLVARERTVRFGRGHRKRTTVWTYNGGIPGPTIKGKVGDKLIVHFWNHLPEETTVHWHGMEVPADQDGSHISQPPVQPRHYRRYEFDLTRASLYWYHPHIRTDEQIERGLYGALLVEDPEENESLGLPEGNDQHVLVLDDILLDERGRIAEHFSEMADPLARAKQILDGREGNLKLVNGKNRPTLRVRKGVPQRLRVVNTANSTFMRLSLSGESGMTAYRIGGDGGLLESPRPIEPIGMVVAPPMDVSDHSDRYGDTETGAVTTVEEMIMGEMMISDPDLAKGVLLTPGERADIVFTPLGDEPIRLEWHDTKRGRHNAIYDDTGAIVLEHDHMDGRVPRETLMTFLPSRRGSNLAYQPPAFLRDIPELEPDVFEPLVLKFGHGLPDANGDVMFFAQDMMKPFMMVTPDDAYDLEVGKTYIWEVWNMTPGIHNFHPHGFFVQLLETEYVDMDDPDNNYTEPAPFTEWKDTVAIPARPGARMRSRTVQRYLMKIDDTGREGRIAASGKTPTERASGGWFLHCHISEHARTGMGTFFEVFDPNH